MPAELRKVTPDEVQTQPVVSVAHGLGEPGIEVVCPVAVEPTRDRQLHPAVDGVARNLHVRVPYARVYLPMTSAACSMMRARDDEARRGARRRDSRSDRVRVTWLEGDRRGPLAAHDRAPQAPPPGGRCPGSRARRRGWRRRAPGSFETRTPAAGRACAACAMLGNADAVRLPGIWQIASGSPAHERQRGISEPPSSCWPRTEISSKPAFAVSSCRRSL